MFTQRRQRREADEALRTGRLSGETALATALAAASLALILPEAAAP